jgi:phosphoribosylglycinamide formyltransferase-1
VHFVDAGTDTGPIIAQAVVPVLDTDTEDSLGARILREEHRLLVAALAAIADDEVTVVPAAGGARPRVRLGERAAARFSEARL